MHTATTEAAAQATEQARRTGCPHALSLAERQEAAARFDARNQAAHAATQRETARLDAIGPAGRDYERCTAAYSPTL